MRTYGSLSFHDVDPLLPELKTSGGTTWFSFVIDGLTAATWFLEPKDVERFKAYVEAIRSVNAAFDSLEAVADEVKAEAA